MIDRQKRDDMNGEVVQKMKMETVNQVVEEVIRNEVGIFDCVFYEYIKEFLNNLVPSFEQCEQNSTVQFDYDNCFKTIGNVIKTDLIEISQRTLISKIFTIKDELVGDSEREKYDNFCKTYLQEGFNIDFAKDKTLNQMIQTKLHNRLESIQECIQRLGHDYEELKEEFHLDTNTISKIRIGEGDTHNGGRSVCIIECDNGNQVIYKPHSLVNDALFNGFIEMINRSKEIKYPFSQIKILDKEDYGWQEFIATKDCESTEEAQRYMYRFGMVVAIAYLFNTTDLHFENIIAQGENLFIIDLETLFFNSTLLKRDGKKMEDGLGKILRHSIYNSALLPSNFLFTQEENSIDFSGLTGGYSDMMYRTQIVVDKCTPDIRFEEMVVNVREGMNTGNVVRVNGELIHILDYAEDLLEGFTDCYQYFINNKSELEKVFEGEYWSKGIYRQVVRHTQLYWKFLQAVTHPYYIGESDQRHNVFLKLYNNSNYSKERIELGLLEEEQLMNVDIPFFFTTYDSKNLYTHNGKEIENFYAVSIKDIILENLEKMTPEDLARQSYLVKVSLMKVFTSTKEISNLAQLSNKEMVAQNVSDMIVEVTEQMMENYLLADINGINNNMFTVSENEGNGYSLDVLHFGMYYGGGVVNVFMQLYDQYQDERYRNVAIGMLNTYNEKLKELDRLDIGSFSGIASLLWLNYNAYQHFNRNEYYENCLELIRYLLDREKQEDDALDLMSGYAGVIIVLSKIYDELKLGTILAAMEKYLDLLVERLDCSEQLTGFAHGLAGMSVALLLSRKYFSDKYYAYGMKCLEEENKYFSQEHSNWKDKRKLEEEPKLYWCYGATGILASRLMVLDVVRPEDVSIIENDIKRCITALTSFQFDGKNMKYNLCHGILGNLDVLRSYVNRYKEDTKTADYLKEQDRILLEHLQKNQYVSDIPMGIVNTDFMLGISGLLYYLMRCNHTELNSFLLLEV